MKKILSIILVLCLSVSLLSACSSKDNSSDIDTNSQISAVEDVKINSEKVQIDSTAFDEGVILKAEEYTNAKIEELFSKTEKTNVYELTAKLNDKIVQPNGDVAVTFPIPKEYDEALHSIAVFYIDDNYNAELLESQIKENIVEVNLSHFSLYSVSIIDKSIVESVISGIKGKTDKTETSKTNSTTTQSNNKNPSSITNSPSQTTNNSDAEAKAKAEAEAKKKAEEEAKRKAEEEAKKKAEAEAKAQAERDAKNPLKSLKYNTWYCFTDNSITVPEAKIKAVLIKFYKNGTGDAGMYELTDELIPELSDTPTIVIDKIPYYECAGLGGEFSFELNDTKITLKYITGETIGFNMNGNSELLVIEDNFENKGLFEKGNLFSATRIGD